MLFSSLTGAKQRVLVNEELNLVCVTVCIEVYCFLEGTVHIRDVFLSLQEELELIYFGRARAEYSFCVACAPFNKTLSCYYNSHRNSTLILVS